MNSRSDKSKKTQSQKSPVPAQNMGAPGQGRERIAKVMARAGLCSRREAEAWIEQGRVEVNGRKLDTPAHAVGTEDQVVVDGKPLNPRERTRLWLFHKPSGTVTTNRDPEGRQTVFSKLPGGLPRLLTVGRLDINTEGLLLMTNDGGLARALELPSTGWLRRYRVRVYGKVDEEKLAGLADGIAVDGVLYGPIEAVLEQTKASNSWLVISLREGKNREVKNVLGALGLEVSRLIRTSYGPFQLGDLPSGVIREVRSRTLREQLGARLIEEAGADFEAPILNLTPDVARSASKAALTQSTNKPVKRIKVKPGQAKQEALDRMTTRKPIKGKSTSRKIGRPAQTKK